MYTDPLPNNKRTDSSKKPGADGFKPDWRKSNDFFFEKFTPNKRSSKSANGAGNFQSLFELAANRLGVGTEVKAIRICNQSRQILTELFAEQSSKFQVLSYKNNTLNLSASSSSERQRLFTKKHLLQSALNKAFGELTVEKIIIKTS